MFLAWEGARNCPTCGRLWDAGESPLLLTVIADYLLLSEGKSGERATRTRLDHVTQFINQRDPSIRAAAADESFVNDFRKWMSKRKIRRARRGGDDQGYSLSMTEGCVLQLKAAINSTSGHRAQFSPESLQQVANSPTYRADVKTIASMFKYCLEPDDPSVRHWKNPGIINEKLVALRRTERHNLLRYLRAAVATWARPDAIYDLTDRQWFSDARVLDLNPPNRRQTRKYRPKVPIAKQFAPHLDQLTGAWLPVASIRAAWDRMADTLELPAHGEAGEKLIRRSMSTLVRKRIGEAQWRQGEMMLGHVKASISDIYAIPDPANLGVALAAIEDIIDEIEKLVPGAFSVIPSSTAKK